MMLGFRKSVIILTKLNSLISWSAPSATVWGVRDQRGGVDLEAEPARISMEMTGRAVGETDFTGEGQEGAVVFAGLLEQLTIR